MSRAQLFRAERLQPGRRRTGLFVMALLVMLALAVVGASVAYAYLTFADSSNAHAAQGAADSLAAGNQPSLSGAINGQNVTIAWAANTTVTRHGVVTGYTINRYSTATGGSPVAATGGCVGTVTALSCTEQNVTPGTWFYAVTPHLSLWAGTESPRSSGITVNAATFSVTANQSLSAASLPTTVGGGAVTHFFNTETVTFHLDTATGTTLTTAPATVATNSTGQVSGFSLTIPANTLGGSHTIFAVGNSSAISVQSNTFTITASATALAPTSGTVGSPASVTAKGFQASHALTVTVGGNPASIISGGTTDSNGNATVTFTIPAAPNGAEAVVVSDGTSSATSATNFTVNASATGLSPTSGTVGATGVTITAQGFKASHALTVTVGGSTATITGGGTSDTTGSSNVTFTIPALPNGARAVVVSDGTNTASSGTNFTVNASATGLAPTTGTVGTTGVTITAQGFTATSNLTVKVGGNTATITNGGTTDTNGSATVTFTIPATVNGSQAVTVTDASAKTATSGTNFVVTAAVTVAPTAGTVGTTATLTGTGYVAGKTVAVTFNGSPVTTSPASPSVNTTGGWTATFSVPASPNGARTIVATDTGGATSSTSYTVNASATGLAPTSGPVGTSATIVAQGYAASHALTVTVNGNAATVTSGGSTAPNGSSTVTFTIPASPNGAQVVNVSDGTNNSGTNFTITQTATGLSPTTGPVGTTGVTINAQGFLASHSLTVTVGGTSAAITGGGTTGANGASTVTFTIPPVTLGAQPVVVSDGTNSATSATNFTVTFGAASQIVLSGSTADLATGKPRTFTATIQDASGNTVTSGTDSSRSVTFGKTAGTGSLTGLGSAPASGGVATITVTGNATGTVTLQASATLTQGATTSNTLSFNVNPLPTVSSPTAAAPCNPGHNGTANCTITGTNFEVGVTVTISTNGSVNSVTRVSSTQLTINVTGSGGNGGKGNVTVTNPDGGSVTVANGFSNG
jgi:hypothetical protein